MTELTTSISKRQRVGKGRQKRHNLKTDMTPMVDLGFLLISFFVITTELSKPKTTNLNMPKDGDSMPLGESDALTILIGKNNVVYYYNGDWDQASGSNQVFRTSFSPKEGLRKVIREKQQLLGKVNKKEGRNGLMLLIKPGSDADYGSVVDLLDEALIHDVKKYMVLKPQPEEASYLELKEQLN